MTSFASGVKVHVKVWYGVAIFDSDVVWEPDFDSSICPLNDVAFSEEFKVFARSKNVIVSKWVGEDCQQVLLASAKHYTELESIEFFGDMEVNAVERQNVIDVQKHLVDMIQQKHQVRPLLDNEPQWIVHLYYN